MKLSKMCCCTWVFSWKQFCMMGSLSFLPCFICMCIYFFVSDYSIAKRKKEPNSFETIEDTKLPWNEFQKVIPEKTFRSQLKYISFDLSIVVIEECIFNTLFIYYILHNFVYTLFVMHLSRLFIRQTVYVCSLYERFFIFIGIIIR